MILSDLAKYSMTRSVARDLCVAAELLMFTRMGPCLHARDRQSL